MLKGVEVRLARPGDAESIRLIYNLEVETSTVTLDLVPRSLLDQQRYLEARSGTYAVLVAEIAEEVVAFGSLSPYRDRPGYNATAEDSIYVARNQQGQGLGRVVLAELLAVAASHGFHSVMARVAGGHLASRRLHESLGFRYIGTEREVGRKFGRWIDMDLLQRML
ncbi:MAG: N-acetyltransferase family protein [Acidimicrobiales bacterium]